MINKIILFLIVPLIAFSQEKDKVAMKYAKEITANSMFKNLSVLASDEYEGRETGEKGQKMAAAYIANQFKEMGIPPYKDTSYYQRYPLTMLAPAPLNIEIEGKKYTRNKDYYNFPLQTEQKIETQNIIFLGYGIEDSVYNDYKGVDVFNRVIMIMDGEPFSEDSLSLITQNKISSKWSFNLYIKIEAAKQKKVAALLIVKDDIGKEIEKNKTKLAATTLKLTEEKEMPIIYISKLMANEILKFRDTENVKRIISETKKPLNVLGKSTVIIDIQNNTKPKIAENVLGYIEGGDLKEELIVISAHYDHLGKEGNVVYNGADDDGSGTVAIIDIAKAFIKAKKDGHGPRRSILFIAFSGEEKGLLGSAYYVENPVFPLKNTVCDLNIDMIGRIDDEYFDNPDYVYLIGSDKLSFQLHNISEGVNKTYTKIKLDYKFNDEKDRNRYYYRSDHYNFAKNGVPVIFYFNGIHADYHRESDEIEKINFDKIQKIARLVYYTAWEIANRTDRIVLDSERK